MSDRMSTTPHRSYFRRILPWYVGKVAKLKGSTSIGGCRFDVSSPLVPCYLAGELMLGHYENAERRLLKRFLDPTLPVIELGGSSGIVSCLTNRALTNPRAHVVVEANPHLLPLLERNRSLNRGQFEIVHAAIAYGVPCVSFMTDHSLLGNKVSADGPVTVNTTSLAALIHARDWEACTLLCDIEGAEADMVDHDAAIIAERVHWIMMETHEDANGNTFDRVWPRLRSAFDHLATDSTVQVFRRR